MKCAKCGFELPPNATFCTQCGQSVNGSYCAKCGGFISTTDKFCAACGSAKDYVPTPAEPEQSYVNSKGYKIASWLFFFAFLIFGITALTVGTAFHTYKGIIVTLCAFIFIPQVKVSKKSPFTAFGVKFFVALLICFLL